MKWNRRKYVAATVVERDRRGVDVGGCGGGGCLVVVAWDRHLKNEQKKKTKRRNKDYTTVSNDAEE